MLKETYPYYLANKPVFANTDLEVTNKYTGEVATRVAKADATVINQAADAAVKATEAMRKLPAYQRSEVLSYCVEKFKERHEELSRALCIEAGKPIRDARGETTRLIDTFKVAAEEALRMGGEYMPLDISKRAHGYTSLTKRVPIGPVSLISPFNFPLNLAAHKVAPAIASGCPFVLKPASKTPIGALIIGETLAETDLPEGAFSILPCPRDDAELFITDERFKLLSFTGSQDVGWDLKTRAGKKRVCLELGGNAGCIVDAGTDPEYAANRIVFGAFYQSGQSCISVQRIFVHSSLYDDLLEKLVAKASVLQMGDPLNEDTFLGPMITEWDARRVDEWVHEAVDHGAKLLCGGKREGAMYAATILTNVNPHDRISSKEVFGPVACVEPFDDFKDAVARVNDSQYGLQAGVFTENLHHAFYAWNEIECGGVVIGDVPSFRVDSMPYGGVKDSGFGREGIRYAMEEMTEPRLLVLNQPGELI